jgi:D-alanine--poly(phosphoribitol) ligase subunit 2
MTEQPTASDLKQELRAFIAETFLELRPDVELADDDRFLALGVIDSLGLLELVEEIRNRYGIEVEDIDITEQNFGSIAALASYIEGKRAA